MNDYETDRSRERRTLKKLKRVIFSKKKKIVIEGKKLKDDVLIFTASTTVYERKYYTRIHARLISNRFVINENQILKRTFDLTRTFNVKKKNK